MNDDPVTPASSADDTPDSSADLAPADPLVRHANLAAQKSQYLRLAADFENFRKRTRRDSERQAAAAKDAFIHDLLPVLDDLERALASEQTPHVVDMALRQLRQLGQLLRRHGIEAADDVGQPFDPHRHAAVLLRHDPTQPDHVILEVAQRGYCRGDLVFRPAKVIVNDLSPFGADDVR